MKLNASGQLAKQRGTQTQHLPSASCDVLPKQVLPITAHPPPPAGTHASSWLRDLRWIAAASPRHLLPVAGISLTQWQLWLGKVY